MQITKRKTKPFDGSKMRVGIVVARFNESITSRLLETAREALAEHEVNDENVKVISVPGAVEIPYALQALAQSKKYDCLVALGCVIRGETTHHEYVCKFAQEGILRIMLDSHIPIGFGILTLNNPEEAESRIDSGADATVAALELANIKI